MKSDSIPWIETFTGRAFAPTAPDTATICIEDIAHALALKCRFNGHCRVFYSVAEHSVRLTKMVRSHAKLMDEGKIRITERAALMHDASEAYLADVPRPVKGQLKGYKAFEMMVEQAIAHKFGLQWPWPREVKKLDTQLLLAEAAALMPSQGKDWETFGLDRITMPITPWSAEVAERAFLETWEELNG